MPDKPIENEKEIVTRDELEISQKSNNESGLQKLFRAGVLALGMSVLGKKMGVKNNELLKYTGVAAASMIMSNDDDRSGDLLAVAAVAGISGASRIAKTATLSNPKTYMKFYRSLEKMDKTVNNLNIALMSLKDVPVRSYKKNYQEIAERIDDVQKGKIITNAKTILSASYSTIKDGVKYLYNNGINKSIEALAETDIHKKYKQGYQDIDFKKIETTVNDYLKDSGIDFKHTDKSTLMKTVGTILKATTDKDIKGITDISAEEAVKEFKQMKKISLIKKNTFFTDLIGMYSKVDEESGKIVANYGRLMKDNHANNLTVLERVADNFKNSLDKESKIIFDKANDEKKEKMFLKYLKDSNMEEIIEKAYNKKDHIKIGEVNQLFEDVRMNEVKNPEIKEFLSSATKNQMKHFDLHHYYDDNDKSVEVIKGIKNADILKNFSFTNVVTKSAQGVSDKTALDGTLMMLQASNAVEKNVLSTFQTVFSKFNRLWNPLSIMDSGNRMKDYIANDIVGMGYNKYGFVIDGKRITEEAEFIKDGKFERINMKYATNGKRNHRISYKKTILDVVNEDYKVANKNVRNDSNVKDIIKTYKTKGAKSALEEFSYSAYNPFFGIRYDKGEGFRRVSAADGYFKDEKNIFDLLDKKNADDSKLLKRTEKMKKTNKVLQFVYGTSEDINIDRMRAESDQYEEVMKAANKKLVEKYIEGGIINKNKDVFLDFKEYITRDYKAKVYKELNIKNDEKINAFIQNVMYMTDQKEADQMLRELGLKDIDQIIKLQSLSAKYVEANQMFVQASLPLTKNNFNKIINSASYLDYINSDNVGTYDSNFYQTILKSVKTNKEKKEVGQLFSVVNEYQKAKKAINRDVGDFFSYSTEVFKDSFYRADMAFDIKTNNSPFNPVYELIRGKRLNDHFNAHVKNAINDKDHALYSLIRENKEILEPKYFKNISQRIADGLDEKIFSNTKDLKVAGKNINELMNNNSSDDVSLKLHSYKYFDKVKEDIDKGMENIDEGTMSRLVEKFGNFNLDDMSFKNMIRVRDEVLYTRPGDVDSSVIVEDSLKKSANVRSILREVKNYIIDMLEGTNKLDVERPKYNTYKEEVRNFKSKNFNKADSTFNIFGKSIINGAQNALEYIGVERLSNAELGEQSYQQFFNFMTKRYMPIAGAVVGAMAIDSASDAIIPDEVPIVGNGISGVAAKGYATARIGAQYALKYTGGLSLMRMAENAMPGLISGAPILGMLDPLMDPEEMIDVYFKGKAVRVNENRWWFTAGRQSGQGEEFGQYRTHRLYQLQNKTAGIYDNKIEKFFRRDFLPTKYLWYMADPYKEERDAYEKFGALYPKTEQLFLDVPVIGHLLNATIGEVIKPTQYVGEERWKVGDNMMLNPNYNPNNDASPKYIHYEEPNKFIASFFEAVEDLESMSGLPGYIVKTTTRGLFGAYNPYENDVTLKSIDKDTSYYKQFENLQLGGLYGTTEPVRRLLGDTNGLNTIDMNPLMQEIPEWMPEFYKRGNNPYMMNGGEYLMPGEAFGEINEDVENEDLLKLRTLSMLAPYSHEFDETKAKLLNANLNKTEQEHLYASIGFANEYGKTNFIKKRAKARKVEDIELRIDKKISYNEFISDGVRYKLDTVTDDFNKLSSRYGASEATEMINRLQEQFKEGSTYTFNISKDATISGGIDRDGDYFKISNDNIDERLDLDQSAYNGKTFSEFIGGLNFMHNLKSQNAMPLAFEKRYGVKTATAEWATEHVQSPSFRDWDSPISSFVAPFYTFSANSALSAFHFGEETDRMFLDSNATINVLGNLVKLGQARNIVKNVTFGDAITSGDYKDDTIVQDELEKIKFLSGDKSYYNMTGNENLKQFEDMLNEDDSKFLEELANTQNSSERKRILSHANERMSNVLKTIWNRQQQQLDGTKPYDIEKATFNKVLDIGHYDGNEERAKVLIKNSLGIRRSKLDDTRYGIISSYRGSISANEARYISNRMYQRYGSKASIDSTIYPGGTINVNMRRDN